MTTHDAQYDADVAQAEREAQRMRRGNALGRVLWGLVEGVTTGLGMLDETLTKVRALHDSPAIDLSPLAQQLTQFQLETAARERALSDQLHDLVAVLSQQAATLRLILAFTQVGEAGPATQGFISLDGLASRQTGVNEMADSVKDNAGPKSLSVVWNDEKGSVTTNVTDAWAGDNDAVGTVTADSADPTKAVFTPVAVGTVNVTVTGTNPDGTTAAATDAIAVTPGDAVSGTISLG